MHKNNNNNNKKQTKTRVSYRIFGLGGEKWFATDKAVKLLVATSIFNPAELPTYDSLSSYGVQQIKELADFYGTEASVTYHGVTYTSQPFVAHVELVSEWKVFRRALCKEKELLMSSKGQSKCPSLQDLLQSMQATEAYKGIFPQTFYISCWHYLSEQLLLNDPLAR